MDENIITYSKELRLPAIRRYYKEYAQEAARAHLDYELFLLNLMEKEFTMRQENRKKALIRRAEFPSRMYLNELKRELLPEDARNKLSVLERLDFIEEGQNIVLAGNPGTGKTHLAVGLGSKACIVGLQGIIYHRSSYVDPVARIAVRTHSAPIGS